MLEIANDIWRPALEILLLAIAIYYVATFIRGTRGAAVFTGFLVLLVVGVMVTHFLQLQVLKWLLSRLTQFIAIAVVVIFQPEVRRMLAKLGNMQLFASTHREMENIEVIIQTVERLADVRIGMLLAIEQTLNLEEAAEGGVAVDCIATPEMLECIFFPNNAIHDGGVIVRDGRIRSAACIFPLSRRQDLNKSLGTRHRAALGLSEETDALVVVVSEETGAISYAHKGQLVRGVSIEELRAFLTSVIVTQSPKPRNPLERLRSMFGEATKPRNPVVTRNGSKSYETPRTGPA